MRHVNPRARGNHCGRQVLRCARTCIAKIQHAGLRLGFRHQPSEIARRHIRMHHQQIWNEGGLADRREIALRIEGHIAIKRAIRRMCRTCRHHQRIAIGGSARDSFTTDITSGTRAIFNHDRLAKPGRNRLSHQARCDVCATARREGNNHANGAIRAPLRLGQRGACCHGREPR